MLGAQEAAFTCFCLKRIFFVDKFTLVCIFYMMIGHFKCYKTHLENLIDNKPVNYVTARRSCGLYLP